MNAAMSEQQNSTTRATSSGTPIRPSGLAATRASTSRPASANGAICSRTPGVSMIVGATAEHADPEGAEVEGQGFGDPDDSVLRRDVGADPGARLEPGGRREVDDHTAARHSPGRLPRACVDPADVHLQHPVDERVVDVERGPRRREDAGVVDPDLQPAELGDGKIRGGGERRRVGGIEGAADGPTARLGDLLGDRSSGVTVEIAGDHLGAGLGQPAHDLGADTPAGAGDDGAPPAQGDQLGERPVADIGNGHGRRLFVSRPPVAGPRSTIRRR